MPNRRQGHYVSLFVYSLKQRDSLIWEEYEILRVETNFSSLPFPFNSALRLLKTSKAMSLK